MERVTDLFNLKGKVAIVTGGATGIGLQVASGLGEAGAQVVLCARNFERCVSIAKDLKDQGINAYPFRCDVAQEEEIIRMTSWCIQQFGKIDILVNNAGAVWGCPAIDVTTEQWMKVIKVNLLGAFLTAQAVGKEMIKRKQGNIINITSVTGFVGSDPELQDAVSYNATKGALHTLTKDLAVKWVQHGIRVNAIAPGWFPTKLTSWALENVGEKIKQCIPMKRFGFDYELKGAAVYLASDASSYVTGHTLVVDGGFMAW